MKAILLLIFILSVCNMFTLPGTKPGKHISHEKIFGKTAPGYNKYILKAVDKIQGQVMNGGGYYTNLNDKSKESPIGYELKIFNHSLITPPRQSSYCTGATFAAFIEALNLIYPEGDTRLTLNRYEALRMQEMNGSRREDFVKVWGNWNSQWGAQYVIVKYVEMGKIVSHRAARPGDFINILFKAGGGHSAIFLGWNKNDNGEIQLMYWSSQPETNGISDHVVSIGKIAKLAVVRLTDPGKIFSFDAAKKIFFQEGEFGREVVKKAKSAQQRSLYNKKLNYLYSHSNLKR
ncbi:MAG: hypothetical protein JSV88_22160 [Candidatus Aminicenantes bacterium]|nr:MAG: hypothetical protein JSV88_22160 [Candidatus Aminicenantes bacterium]